MKIMCFLKWPMSLKCNKYQQKSMFFTCASIIKVVQKSNKKVNQKSCKILSKTGLEPSWKTCSKKVPKIFPKLVFRAPKRNPKSTQSPPQDPLGATLGPSLVVQIWLGVSREGPRRLQEAPGRSQEAKKVQKPMKIDSKMYKSIMFFCDVWSYILRYGLEKMDPKSCKKQSGDASTCINFARRAI